MPAPAASAVTELRQEMLATERRLLEIYSRVSGGRVRFSTAQRVRAERELATSIQALTDKANRFYSDRMPELFLQGAKEVAPDYQLSQEDLELLGKISDDGMIKIQASNELAKRDIDRWGQVAEGSRYKAGTKKHQVRGIVTEAGARLRPQQYSGLVLSADASRLYNFGLVTGARAAGFGKVMVHDGSDCGLRRHDDPERANGLVLTLDTAMAHPLSHPYCVRTFEAYDGERRAKGSFKSLAKTTAQVAAAGAVAGVAGAVVLRQSITLQRRITELLEKANPAFAAYRQRVLQVARTTRESVDDIEISLRQEMEEWALDESASISERSRILLGIDELVPRKVVGDTYENLTDFDRLRGTAISDLDIQNSVGGHLTSMVVGDGGGTLSWRIPRVFANRRGLGATIAGSQGRISGRVGRDLSASVSRKIGDKFRFGVRMPGLDSNVIPFMNYMPHNLVRYRISKIKHGVANRLVLNPNGILRAGFAIDPRTGYVTPSLRFLPKGPIRIFTEVNRSPGRIQKGVILKSEIEDVMVVGRVAGKTVDNSFREIMDRGRSGAPGFLRASDFKAGSVKDMLRVTQYPEAFEVDSDVIRRGRISRALSVEDPDTGKRTHVDLLIRNGKFVLDHRPLAGRITSVTAEMRISVVKGVRFNIRTNFNLRQLQLDQLSDIRHLTLRDLQKIDPKHAWRVRSFTLQLHAFNKTIWQIGKTLRMPWEDAQRLYRDALDLVDKAFKGELLDEIGRQIAPLIGSETMSRQAVLDYLRRLPGEIRERLGDVPEIIRISLKNMKQRYIDDPITWVFGSLDRLGKLSKTLEVKYKRPVVTKLFPEDDPPVIRPSVIGDSQIVEDMSRAIYLTPEELSEELALSLDEALEIQNKAYAYFGFNRSERYAIGAMPKELRKYAGASTSGVRTNLDPLLNDPRFVALFTEDADFYIDQVTRDIRIISAMVEDQFPHVGEVTMRLAPGDGLAYDGNEAFSAFWVNSVGAEKMLFAEMEAGRISRAVFDETVAKGFTDEIWINPSTVKRWSQFSVSLGGELDLEDWMTEGLRVVTHEFGHHVHLSNLIGDMSERNFSKKFARAIAGEKNIPIGDNEDLTDLIDANGRMLANEWLSNYGISDEYEFVAESFTQYWLRGRGRRDDPIGPILIRLLKGED